MRIQEITEAVRPDVLYHATKCTNDLFAILRSNKLIGYTEHAANLLGKNREGVLQGVSLTRSLDFAERFGDGNAILVLDRPRLKTRYRITPIDYYSKREGFDDPIGEEDEEFVITPEISPLSRYLVSVRINPETYAAMQEFYGVGMMNELHSRAAEITIVSWRSK
jgi:hypothetical protein